MIDTKQEHIAVTEANRLGIPVVAVVDTNCDPDGIDYVVPGNDDALKAIRLFADGIADACIEGSQMAKDNARREYMHVGGSAHVTDEDAGAAQVPAADEATGPEVLVKGDSTAQGADSEVVDVVEQVVPEA